MKCLVVGVFLLALVPLEVSAQVDLTSSNLPIIVIDIHNQFISDEPKIMADMGIIDNGPGQRNNITDPYNNYNGKIGIEYRGSSSQGFPKKPYGVELQDASGNGISAAILGMPAEEDWALIATYNDKSLIRDALAYQLGRDLGRYYSPRTRFVELVIKSEFVIGGTPTTFMDYQGVYMVAERVKRDKNRVDIAKLEPHENSGDDLTGGYILKIDKSTGNSSWGFLSQKNPPNRRGSQRIAFQVEYPKYEDLNLAQMNYIENYVTQFENVLASSTYDDPVNGYQKYIDADSFVDYLILNEISKNVDGYRISTYFYKDKNSNDGRLTMAPIWDFNLAFGNADYCSGAPTYGWMYNFNSVCGDDGLLIPFWWQRLLSDKSFQQRLAVRWEELRANQLSIATINTYIDSLSNVLKSESTSRNFTKWPVLGTYVWPNAYVGPTYESEINWLKNWIRNRMVWLDSNMPEVEIHTPIETEPGAGDFIVSASPNPFQGNIDVSYTLHKPGQVDIELFNIYGVPITTVQKNHSSPGVFKVSLEPGSIATGIYILKARTSFQNAPVVIKLVGGAVGD